MPHTDAKICERIRSLAKQLREGDMQDAILASLHIDDPGADVTPVEIRRKLSRDFDSLKASGAPVTVSREDFIECNIDVAQAEEATLKTRKIHHRLSNRTEPQRIRELGGQYDTLQADGAMLESSKLQFIATNLACEELEERRINL